MRKFYILISIFTFLFLSIFVISNFISPKVVNVNSMSPNFVDHNLTATASGTIKSSEKIEIKLDFDVVIKEFKIKVGDKIKQGDILFIIDKERTLNLLKEIYSEQEIEIYKTYIDSYKFEYISEYNGVVSKVNLSETISAGESIVDISSGSGFIASVNVLEKDIANIELGQEADITGEALDGVHKGKVISIANEATKNNAANKNETTVNVILSIEDQSKKLKSGYNIKANIIYAKIKNAATIPYEALKEDEKSYYIYKLYNNEFIYKSRVDVIAETNDYVIINGNIGKNTKICITNNEINENITRVNVISEGIKY